MSIKHTMLNVHQFTEAVKNTSPYLAEKAGGIRNLMVSHYNIDRMYEYYGQAHRHEDKIEYLKQNPNVSRRFIVMIDEILKL
jgi:hypothetical protein